MKGKPVFISFQGAESGLVLWLNGVFIGYSEDSFTPSEFELTSYVKEGVNKLAVQVFKWTGSSWCEDQDFFRFSGIYRDVYLYTIPEVHVQDVRVRTLLDDTFTNADLELVLKASGKGSVKFTLSDKGKVLHTSREALEKENTFVIQVKEPRLWSAEEPVLYDLLMEIFDKQGNLIGGAFLQKVGFRRFEMKGNIMTLNGKRIVFKGVNRHEFSSSTGRQVRREDVVKWILLL